jgi:negative regulator of sigma E activity
MSDQLRDPELEALLAELTQSEEERARLLEEHRQLEKDLLRLADPLPPADFVQKVMAKVEAAPARAVSRAEIFSAAGIVFATLALAVLVMGLSGSAGSVGLVVAQLVVFVREAVVAMGSALAALWRTAAVPMVAALGMMLVLSLVALRRLTVSAQPIPAKVVS